MNNKEAFLAFQAGTAANGAAIAAAIFDMDILYLQSAVLEDPHSSSVRVVDTQVLRVLVPLDGGHWIADGLAMEQSHTTLDGLDLAVGGYSELGEYNHIDVDCGFDFALTVAGEAGVGPR